MSKSCCPRCGGITQRLQDADGPWLTCYHGCWQMDLLQPPPEQLALLLKVVTHNEGPKKRYALGPRLSGYPMEEGL